MKTQFRKVFLLGSLLLALGTITAACSDSMAGTNEHSGALSKRSASEQSKKYWYDGTAEITSYNLTQARYGEMRDGKAVMVFVTEPFSPKSNTKADGRRDDNVQVLKLNAMKTFNTGIYPYSLMTSTFFPFENESKSLKIAFTMQEWCGTMFSEMRNKGGDLSFSLDSYFEGESFENETVITELLEDDIWSLLRLNPEALPEGASKLVPSMAYLRMKHIPLKAYNAELSKSKSEDGKQTYTIQYAELNRTVIISYESKFPYSILGWEESYPDGGAVLTSKATRIKQIKSPYWNKSSNKDAVMRTELGLD